MATQDRSGSVTPRRNRVKKPQPKSTAPEVVYTPARPFHRNRLILRLLTILAVVLAISLGLSIFFKVDTITVTGTNKYSAWTVREASDIEKGDSLLFFGKASAGSKIIAALPYVRSVRFDITLPGTVNIIVEEAPVAYSIKCTDGLWWLITADGRVVEQTDGATANNCTTILGVQLHAPKVGEQAVAAEQVQEGENPVVITGADRLNTALEILQQLEANEILGKAASVDVTKMQALEFWYGKQYQVELGDSSRLDYKIAAVKQAVSQMSQYQTGILDASFTTFSDRVGYRAFRE